MKNDNIPYVTSEYGILEKVILHRPEYLTIKKPINAIAAENIGSGRDVNIEKACKEFDEQYVEAFKSYGVEVILVEPDPTLIFAVNTRDLGVSTPKGIFFGRFVFPSRWGEHQLTEKTLQKHKIPIYYKLNRGTFEGGDFMYVDEKTVFVGIGCRTNKLGVKALKLELHELGIDIIPVDFDEKYLHLDMICNIIGEKVAVVCPDAIPDHALKLLKNKNFELIEVSKEDVFKDACNLVSIGNETVFSHPNTVKVNQKLKSLGFNVEVLDIREIMLCGGGPRCISFPLLRI